MSTQPSAEHLKREIQATLEARRELGPSYDEQFLDALVEKLTRQVAQARQSQSRPATPAHNAFNAKQRSELAVVSLVFAIPMIAIAGAEVGLLGIAFVCAAIVAVNIIAAKM
jgi:hypothetical protein